MDLHPYDGRTRRFCHGDVDPEQGRLLVQRLLHLPSLPSASGLLYDLSFYSGGIGVIDELALSLPLSEEETAQVVRRYGARTPEEGVAEAQWREDLLWLRPLREATAQFISENKDDFQPACRAADPHWFGHESDVNHWEALWYRDGVLHFAAYDQG